MRHLSGVLAKKGWSIVKALNKAANDLAKKQTVAKDSAMVNKQRYIDGVDPVDYSTGCWAKVRDLSAQRKSLYDLANRLANQLNTSIKNNWLIEDNLYAWLDKRKDIPDNVIVRSMVKGVEL
jgi:hypothetical protein